MEVLVV